MKKTRIVLKEDLDNPTLDILPVRRGCDSQVCACHGGCRVVVGQITRTEYELYLKLSKEAEDFFINNVLLNV